MEDLKQCLKTLESIKIASKRIFQSNEEVFKEIENSVTQFKKLKEDYDIQMENISEKDPQVQIIENVYRISDIKLLFYFLKKNFVRKSLDQQPLLNEEYIRAREFGFKRMTDFALIYLKDHFQE